VNNVRSFLEKGFPCRSITIRYHISGARVSISDFEHGEVISRVKSTVEQALQSCMDDFDESIKLKVSEKVERLEKKRKEIEKELNSISRDISSLKLNYFKDK